MLRSSAMSSSSSSSAARSEPPSQARIAEARRQGRGPRAELACVGVAALLAVLLLAWLGPVLAHVLSSALRRAATDPSLTPWALCSSLGAQLMWPVGLLLSGAAVLMLLSRAVAQGFVFSLRALSPSKRFPAASSVRPWLTPVAVFALGGALFSVLHDALRTTPSSWSELSLRFGLRMACVLALLALLEASLSRAAFLRSLWMTREERRREDREDQGAPETRAARARARREVRP